MNYHALTEQVKQYALTFLTLPKTSTPITITRRIHKGVVEAAVQAGNYCQLKDHDFFGICRIGYQAHKIPDGIFTQQQVDDQTVNLLFFGNFYRMDYDVYYAGMQNVMADRDFFYGSLITYFLPAT
ncbi:MAG: hypothetical protein H7211_08225 [Aquabacterium sp.]|nr:hypothetical protein [Ferruginibacter sp.]